MNICVMAVFMVFLFVLVLDPYGRSPPFTPLGALGSGAFGGLGSPTLGQSYGIFTPETHGINDQTLLVTCILKWVC